MGSAFFVNFLIFLVVEQRELGFGILFFMRPNP